MVVDDFARGSAASTNFGATRPAAISEGPLGLHAWSVGDLSLHVFFRSLLLLLEGWSRTGFAPCHDNGACCLWVEFLRLDESLLFQRVLP